MMEPIRILHAADLHLDTVFDGLPDAQAAQRRSEQRKLLDAILKLAKKQNVQAVMLPGDLFDSPKTYLETIEAVEQFLTALEVPVFIAPGNHDFYRAGCAYDRMFLPENVHMFRHNRIECVEVPELHLRVWGAAFTDSVCPCLIDGFVPDKQPGTVDILCVHGTASKDGVYNPMPPELLAKTGMDYVAMGHSHSCGGLQKAGDTYYLWPGVPMGRGFDETGKKGVVIANIAPGQVTAHFAPIHTREYQILEVDVTDEDPLTAVFQAVRGDTSRDLYRIILTGETKQPIDLPTMQRVLQGRFYSLEMQSRARVWQDLWARTEEATLRGAFLRRLRAKLEQASPEDRTAIEEAARWGVAALDGAEEVIAL